MSTYDEKKLTKALILELFGEIDEELKKQDLVGELLMIGGAVMTVLYDARPATQDVDGIFHPTQPLRDIIKKLGRKHGLDDDWMNDASKGVIQKIEEDRRIIIFEGKNFSVYSPSREYLLATKILASRRGRDYDDIKLLIDQCQITTVDECLEIVERYFPRWAIDPRSQFAVEEIIASASDDH
jgi:hypothetical protein